MNAWLAGGAVLTALTGLLAGTSLLRNGRRITAEAARKAVHVGMGIVCVPFPWLFSDPRPVLILAGIAIAGLLVVRRLPALRRPLGCALHDVPRRSYGELAYVVGIATLFAFAAGDALVYVIPVAVLTVADPAASLVGMRCARYRFTTRDGSKSVAGSLAFFAASAVCISTILLAAGTPDALAAGVVYAVAAGVVASALLMLVEASAWAGFDNFTIPFAGGIIMRSFDWALLGGLR